MRSFRGQQQGILKPHRKIVQRTLESLLSSGFKNNPCLKICENKLQKSLWRRLLFGRRFSIPVASEPRSFNFVRILCRDRHNFCLVNLWRAVDKASINQEREIMKKFVSVCLGTTLLLAGIQAVEADDASTKDQIAAIDKQLMPIRKKAMEEADVKAAADQARAAHEKFNATVEAAMERLDPKAKELLAQRKKLLDDAAAAKKAAAKPAAPKAK